MAKFKCDACGYEAEYERGQPWAPFAYERTDNGEIELPCPQCWVDYVRKNVPQMKDAKGEKDETFSPLPFALLQRENMPLALFVAGYPSLIDDLQKGKNATIDLRHQGIPLVLDIRMAQSFDAAKQTVVAAAKQMAESADDNNDDTSTDLARMVQAGSRKGH